MKQTKKSDIILMSIRQQTTLKQIYENNKEMKSNNIRSIVNNLTKKGKLKRVKKGVYSL